MNRLQPIELPAVHEESWQERAACRGVDPDLFFPEKNSGVNEAKAVCAGCHVRDECLDYALRTGEKYGIWGGKSEKERRILRRKLLNVQCKVKAPEWGDLTQTWTTRAQIEVRMLEARYGLGDWDKNQRGAVRATLRYAIESGQVEDRTDQHGRRWLRLIVTGQAA